MTAALHSPRRRLSEHAMAPLLGGTADRPAAAGGGDLVKPFDDADTVIEPGKAGWVEVFLHLTCVMFGAGVLGLPYALASQGWVLGLGMLVLATGTSTYAAFLLAELHTLRDGRRVRTMRALGGEIWGARGRRWLTSLQIIDCVGGMLIYTVVGGASLANIAHGCFGDKGASCDDVEYDSWPWALSFGAAMAVLSQFKDFHALRLVSFIGALMPFVYTGVALASILAHGGAAEADHSMVRKGSTLGTAMNVFSGIGAMQFAFGGQMVQTEVAATVRAPPAVIHSMRKALAAAYMVIGACYFAAAIAGFSVFGNAVTGNVLQSIPTQGPAIVANVAVLAHVGAAYPAFSMIVFQILEEQCTQRKGLPRPVARRPWLARLLVRALFVGAVTFTAVLFPFFNLLSGLKGGACMVPLCFIAPIALWCSYNRGHGASRLRLALNYALIALFAGIAVVATVGSVCKLAESAAMLAAIVRQHCCRGARHSYCAANLSDPSERQQAQPSNPSERRQLDPRQ